MFNGLGFVSFHFANVARYFVSCAYTYSSQGRVNNERRNEFLARQIKRTVARFVSKERRVIARSIDSRHLLERKKNI